MRLVTRKDVGFAGLMFVCVLVGGSKIDAQYSMTVNRDRLINAQNEPQNWLMMNGDYGSTRYSKLSQVNRENVRNLRMVWALALGGMQDVGLNGPESEVNPLIDNGFMYTSDGWGTIYKIDARNSGQGQFVWVADPGTRTVTAYQSLSNVQRFTAKDTISAEPVLPGFTCLVSRFFN